MTGGMWVRLQLRLLPRCRPRCLERLANSPWQSCGACTRLSIGLQIVLYSAHHAGRNASDALHSDDNPPDLHAAPAALWRLLIEAEFCAAARGRAFERCRRLPPRPRAVPGGSSSKRLCAAATAG